MEPVNFRMRGDVEGLPLHLQLPPALRQGRSGDPYAVLRPALKELAMVESTRVLSAIEDAIWRVDIITALGQISRNVKAMDAVLGSTLVGLVDRHQQVVGTLGDLKARSEVIEKLTSFQLVEAYYKGPTLSFKSADLMSLQSLAELPVASTVEAEVEEWENLPWGPKGMELVPSVTGSSSDSIVQIKRRMKAEDDAARRGITLKSDDDDDDSDFSLKSSMSRINLLHSAQDSEEGSEDGSEEKAGHADDQTGRKAGPVAEPVFEYVQNINRLGSFELLKSQPSLVDALGDNLSETESLPWASFHDLSGNSLHAQTDEMLQAKALRTSLRLVQDQLTMLVRNILRAFRENPGAVTVVVENKQRTDPAEEFLIFLKDLRQVLHQRLLTTRTEEKAKAEYMAEVERRVDGYEQLRQRLDDEIQKVIRDRDKKCREMNDALRKLQLDMMTVEKLAEEYMKRTRQEGEKLRQAELKLSMERRQKPLLEVVDLTARLAKLREEHWDSESVLRRKKYKVETEIENWIKRFDEDMTALQIEYDDVEAAYDVEKAEIEEMEDRFEPMEAAFKEILEERDKLYRARIIKERLDLRRLRAARAVQAWWRSYRVRKAIRIRNQKLEKQRLRELKKQGKKGKRGKTGKSTGGEKGKKKSK